MKLIIHGIMSPATRDLWGQDRHEPGCKDIISIMSIMSIIATINYLKQCTPWIPLHWILADAQLLDIHAVLVLSGSCLELCGDIWLDGEGVLQHACSSLQLGDHTLSPQYHILVEFSFQGSKKFTRNIDVWTISMCWLCQRIGWSPVVRRFRNIFGTGEFRS